LAFQIKTQALTLIENTSSQYQLVSVAAAGYTLAVNSYEYLLDLLTSFTCSAVDDVSWSLN